MKVVITKRGVCFTMEYSDCAANDAVRQALKVAELCGFAPQGIKGIGGKRMLAVIYRVRNADYKRHMFATRLVAELGFRGIAAEVVA